MKVKLHVEELNKIGLQLSNVSQGALGGSYQELTEKPSINGVVLEGNKNSNDLGILTLVEKDSKAEFPNIGKSNCLYLDKTSEMTYWWDEEKNIYRPINADYREVKIINGGNAK